MDDFDNVTWSTESDTAQEGQRSDSEGDTLGGQRGKQAPPSSVQARPAADAIDLAGIDSGILKCTVTTPLKEGDGAKDAYVSYLITTQVCK
jgi:sorting nexin-4